jgi:serine/threonine protein kinase
MDVAVKTLKRGSAREDRVKFLQEAAIMGQFKHSNVVEMYGVVTQGEPVSSVCNEVGGEPLTLIVAV